MAVVDIVIPSYKGMRPAAWTTLVQMMRATECQCQDNRTGARLHAPWQCTKGKHSLFLNPHTQSCIIHWARNASVAQAMYGPHPAGRPPAQWFLLLDDDILVEAHYLARLLSHKQDIVVGICTVRRDPPVPTIRYWRDDKQAFVEPIEWDWNSEKLIEVDAAGAACMLVRRCVLEKMAEAYLDCWLERQEDQRRLKSDQARLESETYWLQKAALRRRRFEAAQAENDWQKQDCWWFQMLSNVTDAQVGELGEDLSFCWKAKRLGFRIYADPQVLPGHLGEYSYSVRDWRAFVEQQVAAGFAPPQQANAPELAAV